MGLVLVDEFGINKVFQQSVIPIFISGEEINHRRKQRWNGAV